MPIYQVIADGHDDRHGNAYLALGETTTLVDTGQVPAITDIVAAYVGDDGLDRVVLTHQHGDHVAELPAIVERFEPEVHAYADHELRTHAIEDGTTVTIGDHECEAAYTPGHAGDHLAFVAETVLFSGDVVVHDDGAFDDGSFGRTDLPGQSRERLIESLGDLLGRLPGGRMAMYAGHGHTFYGDVREVIERALERAERREPKYPE